ncbi:unnamed protein product [Bemisia tabaci]|uniref:AAA-ATPase-like domain-containing protein n=1 Tax=Bemisia tabaci TaxID=7038 RepID=A0A9P0F6Z8_BEMTA|nr:unnamed protein product [Bemisia tabaci]
MQIREAEASISHSHRARRKRSAKLRFPRPGRHVTTDIAPAVEFAFKPFDMLRNSNLFIDQTAFIDTFMGSEDDHVLFSAPRGFGKSTILDMFKRFLEIDTHENGTKKTDKRTHKNYRTFADTIPSTGAHLHIFQQKKFFESNFGEHPVIFLDLDTKGNQTHDSPSYLRFLLNGPIKSAFLDHAYLIHSPIISNEEKELMRRYLEHNQDLQEIDLHLKVTEGLRLLKRLLQKQFMKQPILLVDNIDSQIQELLFDSDPKLRSKDALAKMEFIMFKRIDILDDFSADVTVLKSFITGVLRPYVSCSRCKRQSLTHSNKLAKFFSLSKSQVTGLIASWGINQTVDQLDTWYGLKLNQMQVPSNPVKPQFNPYSIYRFLLSGSTRLRSYWTELDSLLTLPAAFLPECFGQHLLECFEECTFPSAWAWFAKNGWTHREVKELQELRRTGECTSITRATLTLYLMDSGYLFPSAASPDTYQIPNQEASLVKKHVSRLLMAVTTSKCPIHGNKQFRDDLFEALFDVDGSHLNMRRFLDMLVVVLVAEERKGPVPATTLAHSLRVQLINPPRLPNKFNVTYVDTSMIEEQTNQHLWRDSQESKEKHEKAIGFPSGFRASEERGLDGVRYPYGAWERVTTEEWDTDRGAFGGFRIAGRIKKCECEIGGEFSREQPVLLAQLPMERGQPTRRKVPDRREEDASNTS